MATRYRVLLRSQVTAADWRALPPVIKQEYGMGRSRDLLAHLGGSLGKLAE